MNLQNFLSGSIVASLLVGCGGGSCGSCGGGSNPPPAPIVKPAEPPFTPDPVPTGSDTNGAVLNIASGLIAIPSVASGSSGGYLEIAMPADVTSALGTAINSGLPLVINTTQSGQVTVAIKNNDGSSSLYLLSPATKSTQSSLQAATNYVAESFTLVADKINTTITLPVQLTSYLSQPINAILYGYNASGKPGLAVVFPNNNVLQAPSVYRTLNECLGVSNTISATISQGIDYIGVGTTGASTSNVCVASLTNNTITVTNLAVQAPTSKYPSTSTPVKAFGFPALLNQGNNLVGYWYSGNQIYKVLGSYINGTPTGNGFLNVTSGQPQVTQSGQTRVTFTNVPNSNIIYSTYVDNVGNVWVGTNIGSVYVLRVGGYTQWSEVTLGTGVVGGSVTMVTNGTNNGATAVVGSNVYDVR